MGYYSIHVVQVHRVPRLAAGVELEGLAVADGHYTTVVAHTDIVVEVQYWTYQRPAVVVAVVVAVPVAVPVAVAVVALAVS